MKVILTILALLGGLGASAQRQSPAIVRSTEVLTDGNHRYYVHQVQAGETIYSIGRAYGVSQDELVRSNPTLSGGLKMGMLLKIMLTPSSNPEQFTPHVVQKKETLFSIASAYSVSVGAILALNPDAAKALPVGTTIQIPVAPKSAPTLPPHHAAGGEVRLLQHVVRKKETLFSIASLYDVEINDIKLYNPQIFEGGASKIKKGQTLDIPILLSGIKKGSSSPAGPAECDSCVGCLGRPINAVLLLPFDAQNQSGENAHESFRFAEMYEGALLALNALREEGVSVNLTVLDTKATPTSALLRNPALGKADLIIGPVYQDKFIPVAEFAKSKNKKIVSPLTPIDSGLYKYPNVFQAATDFDRQAQQMLTTSLDPTKSNVILAVQRDDEDSKNLCSQYQLYLPKCDSLIYSNVSVRVDSAKVEALRARYEAQAHRPTIKKLSYRIGIQPRENQVTLMKLFHPSLDNKVIVASQEEAFVSELLANLKAFSDRYRCKVTVYGTSKWQKFENIELQLLYDLKLHLAVSYYTDYKSEVVKSFVQSYRDKYRAEPSQFAFQGYDVMLYFMSAIHRYGKNFEKCLPLHRKELLQSTYNFSRIGRNGAYENKSVFLLRYTPWLDIVEYDK
ncbi:MAG: LysM peptidoglycan-binding domain-containing protein [Prevotellaceae bacterium]|jgi:LysM repeat protein|nr:LysM peptidoglycan-binding domain-containing protein [Prevotellaceae bacterium]